MCVVCKCHEAMSHTSVSDCPALLSGPKEKQQLSLSPKLAKKERKIKAYFESRLFVCHLSYSFGHNKWPSLLDSRSQGLDLLLFGSRLPSDTRQRSGRSQRDAQPHKLLPGILVFYSLLKKAKTKTQKGSVTGCVEIVLLGQAVLLPRCGIHHFSKALAPLINAQVGKGRKT